MADTSPEIIHQHYANAAAAIAAMNDQNWAYEEAANRIIVMDGATPVYFETASGLIGGGSFIVNQTASPQSGGFSISGNGIIGGTLTLTGVQTNSAEIAVGASLGMRRTINTGYIALSGGNAINSGANLVMNGGAHATGANDWSFRSGSTDLIIWDDSATLLTVTGHQSITGNATVGGTLDVTGATTLAALSATTGSFSSTLAVSGVQTNSEAIVFGANGTGGVGRIYRTASDGLLVRGITGSTNDFVIEAANGNDIIRNPTGTTQVTFPASGGVSISGTLSVTGATTLAALSATTGTFVIPDNTTTAFAVYEGISGRSYIFINTTNGSENIIIGNSTTDPTIDFPGSGLVTFMGPVEIGGSADFKGLVILNDNATAGAGGTDWTNETSIDIAGANSVEITPTAESQTYRLSNPTNGQVLFVTNTHATYSLYVDGSDGSGTIQLYITPTASRFIRYNGTRWNATY